MRLYVLRKIRRRSKARLSRYTREPSMRERINNSQMKPNLSLSKSQTLTRIVRHGVPHLLLRQKRHQSQSTVIDKGDCQAEYRLESDPLVPRHDDQAEDDSPCEERYTPYRPVENTPPLTPIQTELDKEELDTETLAEDTHAVDLLSASLAAASERRDRLDLVFGLAEVLVEPIYARISGMDIENETVYTDDVAENSRLDEVLGDLTQRVSEWLEDTQLIPQHADDNANGPPAEIVAFALWIVLQVPVNTGCIGPIPFAGSIHSSTLISIQHLLGKRFSEDRDEFVDATERLIVLGLALAHRMMYNVGSWQDDLLLEWHELTGIPLEELELLENLTIEYLGPNIDPLRSQYAGFLRSLLKIHGLWHSHSSLCAHEEKAHEALGDLLWTAIGVPVRWVDDRCMNECDLEDDNTLDTPTFDLDDLVHIIEHENEEEEEEQYSLQTQEDLPCLPSTATGLTVEDQVPLLFAICPC